MGRWFAATPAGRWSCVPARDLTSGGSDLTDTWSDPHADLDARVDDLLNRMIVDEKLAQIR